MHGGAAFFNGARAALRDSAFTSNSVYGVYASAGPTATPTTVRADGVDVSYNGATGIALAGLASSLGTMTITRSTVVGNVLNGFYADGANGPVTATVSDSTFSNQGPFYAAIAAGGAAKIVVSRSAVVDNGNIAFYQFSGGLFESRGDNTVRNNNSGGVQTIGTITPIGGI